MSDLTSNGPIREDGALVRSMIADMEQMTWDRIGEHAIRNAQYNLQYKNDGHSLAALRRHPMGKSETAVIVAAGPSVRRQNPAVLLRDHKYTGTVISTDSGIAHCLRNGIIPDLVVSLDPHPTRIVRWFGDPKLRERDLEEDDYYRRQDLDPVFADEVRANSEIIALMREHGKTMPIALCTSTSVAVVERVLEAGMPIYWWNPMLDDPEKPDSHTKKLMEMNGFPALNAGGNVGSAAWMIADAVLGKRRVALTGMDFGYYDGTPYSATQYYREVVDMVGEDRAGTMFSRIYNPHTETWFISDPAYQWYRECFLEMALDAECETYNCTEGGILFGPRVNFCPLTEFLTAHS
ncbi:MAG: motility associated factor glycosyltransferase family protein [Rhodospirillaceae bacterium]|nr:motility associated factor glycosyltransferase family protein [Rhodospirillales bacterium]